MSSLGHNRRWFAVLVFGAVASVAADAQGFSVLHSFNGNDGERPSGLVRAGNQFVGTSQSTNQNICGAIFWMNPSGEITALFLLPFSRVARYSAGLGPVGEVVFDSLGTAYFATFASTGFPTGGTVTKLNPQTGTATLLYSFGEVPRDGLHPGAGLVRDSGGNLFGTTVFGGSHGILGAGTIFKLDSTGNETVLYSFSGGTDGAQPDGLLLQDAAGNLFGLTQRGGVNDGGVLFGLDKAGAFTVLHRFNQVPGDGVEPRGRLIRDETGNLYGTTALGGAFGFGTIFKLDVMGNETALYSFRGEEDGGVPFAGLTQDGLGNLYGTAAQGGSSPAFGGNGTVFKLDAAGSLTVLHTFAGQDGSGPAAPLLCFGGDLYGTTSSGGDFGLGVAFEIAGACGATAAKELPDEP